MVQLAQNYGSYLYGISQNAKEKEHGQENKDQLKHSTTSVHIMYQGQIPYYTLSTTI